MNSSQAQVVTNRNDARIKAIRQLHQRAERERTGSFVFEGTRFLAEALEQRVALETLVYSEPLLSNGYARHLLREASKRGTRTLALPADIFQSISLSQEPQGIAVVAGQTWHSLRDTEAGAGLCWIALESIHSPGNLGTILRTSDAAGGAGIIFIGAEIDPYDPATVRSTMGAIFAQKLVRASWEEFMEWKESNGARLVGTSPSGIVPFQEANYTGPTVLFMGSERKGLSPERMRCCDDVVRIPMAGRSDSLNLAVATGIMLYELLRQNSAAIRTTC